MPSAFTPAQIAAACNSPEPNVWRSWPSIHAALEARGIADRPVQIAAIATVAIETASTFEPVREAFWLSEDWRRANLRYYPHYGRGHIQLTWESNYKAAGEAIGVDLVSNPDLALDPAVSAKVLAWYFATHGGGPLIPEAARRGDWTEVRRLVQGGSAGLDRLLEIVNALGGASRMVVQFNPNEPNIAQNDPWSCAPTSTRWALKALGRNPSEKWIEDTMIAEGVVSKDDGLLDASGAGLAAFVRRHYGEFGYDANNEPSISWDWIIHEGGEEPNGNGHAYPVLIGGRAWNHWVAVRDYDPDRDVLLLSNPSDGWMEVGQTMNRQQFGRLGPFSAVRVWHPDLFAAPPVDPPPPPPPPPTLTAGQIRARLLELVALISENAP